MVAIISLFGNNVLMDSRVYTYTSTVTRAGIGQVAISNMPCVPSVGNC